MSTPSSSSPRALGRGLASLIVVPQRGEPTTAPTSPLTALSRAANTRRLRRTVERLSAPSSTGVDAAREYLEKLRLDGNPPRWWHLEGYDCTGDRIMSLLLVWRLRKQGGGGR